MASLPENQFALQLTALDTMVLNPAKSVHRPGPHQLLCQVQAAGLCFSDLKLMTQFDSHPRKWDIVEGIAPSILREIPSYVPGRLPTVPGHETVVRVCEVGPGVTRYKVGDRFLVQSDYRWLKTEGSNGAFGYNFEGALQEYVLLDERITVSPEGEDMMVPVSADRPASAIALIEPWACVENAYAQQQRRGLRAGGTTLVVTENPSALTAVAALIRRGERPAGLTWVGADAPDAIEGVLVNARSSVAELADHSYDDILCLGVPEEIIEAAFKKLANNGLIAIVLDCRDLTRKVVYPVGRVHYNGIRIIGTIGGDPAEAYESIPISSEIQAGAKIYFVGAGGPMGVMHVVRILCAGIEGISVYANDTDSVRLQALERIARGSAEKYGHSLTIAHVSDPPSAHFEYVTIMVPIPALVSQALELAKPHGIINIFAGIPAHTEAELDLQAYLEKQAYLLGTSGSTLADMHTVWRRVESGMLDTNVSVAAISGMAGAADGIAAVRDRTIAGKIIVYPWCHGLGLIPLAQLKETLPKVAAALADGALWTGEAEKILAAHYGYKDLA